MARLLAAALDYQRRGLHPIPCVPRGKHPLVGWKDFQQTAPTPAQIMDWWTQWPDANIALVLGRGMFAVDVDGPEGEQALAEAGIDLTGFPRSRTSRGYHVFFSGSTGDRIGLLPKVDIRGIGYVIAPPSFHESGHVYAWDAAYDHLTTALRPAPEALTALMATSSTTAKPSDTSWLTEALAGVGEGVRDTTCARLAGYFWRKGMPPEAIYELLIGWAGRCTPVFPADAVAKTVESISKRDGGESEPELGTRLLTVQSLYETAPDAHRWVWHDYLPEGSLAMLAAEEKAGKSTLAYALAAAVAKGQKFLSRDTGKSPVLMLAVEEHVTDVKLRSIRFCITPADPVTYYVADLPATERSLQQVRDVVVEKGVKLVMMDTVGHYLSTVLDTENDNLAVLKALRPWLRLARDTSACVLLIHHTGKGSQAYRGASAFGGVVDQILTLRHYGGGNQRALTARGRYRETPHEIRFGLFDSVYQELFI